MSKVSKYFAGTALAIFAVTVSAITAFADVSDLTRPQLNDEDRQAMHEEMQEFHNEVQEALLSGDYDGWYDLISQNERGQEVLEVINEDNFEKFVEAHELMEESRAIMEELGLEKPQGMQNHRGPQKGGFGQRGMARQGLQSQE